MYYDLYLISSVRMKWLGLVMLTDLCMVRHWPGEMKGSSRSKIFIWFENFLNSRFRRDNGYYYL